MEVYFFNLEKPRVLTEPLTEFSQSSSFQNVRKGEIKHKMYVGVSGTMRNLRNIPSRLFPSLLKR